MTTRRTLATAALVAAAPLLLMALAAGPASAHGATVNPVSRAAACGPEGGQKAQSAACQAAVAASGVQAFEQWDNLRVARVNGRDREVIPDGKLCSAGIDEFKGLDLARTDWPATRLLAGAGFTFRYRATIPHKGTFRLYVTKNGYDPSQRLRWSDLESKPFLTATDPPLQNGSYTFEGRLPQGRTGRHLIYTIWQNSSTPDTYYSCSDVVFTGTGTSSGSGSGSGTGVGTGSGSGTGVPAAGDAAGDRDRAVLLAAGGVAALVAAFGITALLRRRP